MSKTELSRNGQWIKNANARRARVIAAGGRFISLLLQKEAAEDLADLMKMHGESALAAISAALRLRAANGPASPHLPPKPSRAKVSAPRGQRSRSRTDEA